MTGEGETLAPDIHRLLDLMIREGGSDLHLSVGIPPRIRIHGRMRDVKLGEHQLLLRRDGYLDRLVEVELTEEGKTVKLPVIKLRKKGEAE